MKKAGAREEDVQSGWRERRGSQRYETSADAVVVLLGHGMKVNGWVEDLSQSGCKVEMEVLPAIPAGRRVEIAFQVNRQGLRLAGLVQWSDGRRIGVCFDDLSGRRLEDLNEVIAELAAESARAAAGDKEPGSWSESQKPAAAEEEPEESKDVPPGWERRRSPRQKTALLASLYEIEKGDKVNGQLMDLSLSGCRIRLEHPFAGERAMAVEAGFYHLGLPFRVGGQVRVLHTPTEVGIEFGFLTARKRELLVGLIAELKDEI